MGAPKTQDLRQSMGPKGCLNLAIKWGAAHLINLRGWLPVLVPSEAPSQGN